MLKYGQILLKSVLLLGVLEGTAVSAGGILAFGDIRDHLEPCGCDPRTDVGGLKRLDAVARRYLNQDVRVTILNLGNVSDADKNTPSSQAIIKVLEELHPAASLINVYEWRRFNQKRPMANIPWVLSNASATEANRAWGEIIKANGYEVFGYLGEKDRGLEKVGPKLFKKWRTLTSSNSADKRVLLFSGSDKDLAVVAAANFFGVVIRSSAVPLGTEIGDLEQRNEGLLAKTIHGQVIWSIPFGGAGFLRAGGLEMSSPPKPLAALLQLKSEAAPVQSSVQSSVLADADVGKKLISAKTIHWLRPDEEIGASSAVVKIFDDLRNADKDLFKSLIARRENELKNTEFVGSEACASCHRSSYDVWKNSKHAKAMISLIDKSRHQDAGCVECHVLGFTAKGGYVSEERTPQFSNVQCENCHGPRRQHLENPAIKNSKATAASARAACAECHTPPHSPGFDAKTYWKAIQHK